MNKRTLCIAIALAAVCGSGAAPAHACIKNGYYWGGGPCDQPRISVVPGGERNQPPRMEWHRPPMVFQQGPTVIIEQRQRVFYNCIDSVTGRFIHPGRCTSEEESGVPLQDYGPGDNDGD